ncbi:hypothetical protein [Streptomyces sp. SID13726]|nr:hypothetical protein [Streptomyces sp. SID13726]
MIRIRKARVQLWHKECAVFAPTGTGSVEWVAHTVNGSVSSITP